MVAPANDNIANATAIVVPSSHEYDSGTVSSAEYTNANDVNEPVNYFNIGPWYRIGWWTYTASAAGTLRIHVGQVSAVVSAVYRGTPGSLTAVSGAYGDFDGLQSISVSTGETLYVAVGSLNATLQGTDADNYRIWTRTPTPESAAVSNPVITVSADPVDMVIDVPAVVVTPRGVPPVDIIVDVGVQPAPVIVTPADPVAIIIDVVPPTPPISIPLVVAPILARTRVVPPDLRRIIYGIIDPVDAETLPVTTPTLTGYVNMLEGDQDDSDGDISVDFEYGTGTGSSYVQLGVSRVPVEIYTSYSLAETTLPVLAADQVYYWRMRLVVGTSTRVWTVWWSFTIGTTVAARATLPITAMITGTQTSPHLWGIEPPVGAPGEIVTLIGQGFPTNQTAVTFGDDELEIVSWQHIGATSNSSTATRLIDEDTIDPEHDEIQVVVPDTEEAGASVTILAEGD